MSTSEEPWPPSAAETSTKMDPLLQDFKEKKLRFRRNLASLAGELKEVRGRLASLEHSLLNEASARQEAEVKVRTMEQEVCRLQECLEEKNMQLKASASSVEKYLKELDDLRLQLSAAQATAIVTAVSNQSAQLQCSQLQLLLVIHERDSLLAVAEYETLISSLGDLLDLLHKDDSEITPKELKDEVLLRVEHSVIQAIARAGQGNTNFQLTQLLQDNPGERTFETVLVDVMAKLGDEFKLMSALWKHSITNGGVGGSGRFNVIQKLFWACRLLWRLVSLFFFLQMLGFKLFSYMMIQFARLVLNLVLLAPLRVPLFLFRTLMLENVLNIRQ